MKKAIFALAVWGAIAAGGASASAADIEVKMLNKGEKGAMVFEPDFVRVAPGDTVHFIASDKGHNAESVKGMLPDGAEPFAGKMGNDLTVTLDKEGLYGVRCKPHYGLGMVMLIEVGNPVNLEEAKAAKNPKKAKEKFDEIFAEMDAQ
jgi:pseudoazurin